MDWFGLRDALQSKFRIVQFTPRDDQGEAVMIVELEGSGERAAPIVIADVDMRHEGRGIYARATAPIGRVEEMNVPAALDHLKTTVVGGLTVIDEDLMLQHTLPLDGLDTARAVRPLVLLATTAGEMRQRFQVPGAAL